MAEYQLYQQPGQGQQGGAPLPPPPRPPRQNPYRDGIATSAQHYDLFEMIRHPNATRPNRPPDPPPRPSPHSKQKRLEQEIEKKFKAQQSKQTSQFLALFVRFLFLTLVLPPYLILYRLPKFLLVDWVLFVARFIDNTLAAIGKAIQASYERLKSRLKNAILSFWELIKSTFRKKMSAQASDDEPLSFLAFLAEGIVALYRVTIYPLIRISKKLWRFSKRAVQAVREFPGQVHLKIQESLKRMRSLRDRLVQKIKSRLFQFKEALANRTTRPLSRWVDAKVAGLIALYRRGVDKVKKIGQALLFALRHPIQTSKLALEALRTFSKRSRQRLIASINSWIQAKKEALLKIRQRGATWVETYLKAPLQAKWTQLKARLRQGTAPLVAFYTATFAAITRHFNELKLKISALILARLERLKRQLKNLKNAFVSYCEKIKTHWIEFYLKLHAALVFRLGRIYSFIRALLEPFIWAGSELWNFLLPFSKPIARLYNGVSRRIEAFVYRLRLIAAWMNVLFRYGMELVRGNSEKLFGSKKYPV